MLGVAKKNLFTFLKSLLLDIPLSLLLASIFWFFAVVLGGMTSLSFLMIWKWVYVGAVGLDLVQRFWNVLRTGYYSRSLSKKWGVPYTELIEAFRDYYLLNQNFKEWTAEDFYRYIRASRIAKVVMDIL